MGLKQFNPFVNCFHLRRPFISSYSKARQFYLYSTFQHVAIQRESKWMNPESNNHQSHSNSAPWLRFHAPLTTYFTFIQFVTVVVAFLRLLNYNYCCTHTHTRGGGRGATSNRSHLGGLLGKKVGNPWSRVMYLSVLYYWAYHQVIQAHIDSTLFKYLFM